MDAEIVSKFIKRRRLQFELDNINSGDDAPTYVDSWIQAKSLDENSLDNWMDEEARDGARMLMAVQNPKELQNLIKGLIGKGIEFGYTAAELQLEKFTFSNMTEDRKDEDYGT